MFKTLEKCYFCNREAEYDQVVDADNFNYFISGVCRNHLKMGLSA